MDLKAPILGRWLGIKALTSRVATRITFRSQPTAIVVCSVWYVMISNYPKIGFRAPSARANFSASISSNAKMPLANALFSSAAAFSWRRDGYTPRGGVPFGCERTATQCAHRPQRQAIGLMPFLRRS